MKTLTLLAASVAATVAIAPAQATFVPPPSEFLTTFSFTGLCTDCSLEPSQATAKLTVRNYLPGTPLDVSNFVSFSYHSAIKDFESWNEMIGPFGPEHYLFGSVVGDGKSYNVQFGESIFIFSTDFITDDTGAWSFSQNGIDLDHGTDGLWGLATPAVPEPASWAMMIGGIGVAGAVMRRARRMTTTVTYA